MMDYAVKETPVIPARVIPLRVKVAKKLTVLLTQLPLVYYQAYILTKIWEWFFVQQLDVHAIPVPGLFFLLLYFEMLNPMFDRSERTDDKPWGDEMWAVALFGVLNAAFLAAWSTLALVVFWLLHLLISYL